MLVLKKYSFYFLDLYLLFFWFHKNTFTAQATRLMNEEEEDEEGKQQRQCQMYVDDVIARRFTRKKEIMR